MYNFYFSSSIIQRYPSCFCSTWVANSSTGSRSQYIQPNSCNQLRTDCSKTRTAKKRSPRTKKNEGFEGKNPSTRCQPTNLNVHIAGNLESLHFPIGNASTQSGSIYPGLRELLVLSSLRFAQNIIPNGGESHGDQSHGITMVEIRKIHHLKLSTKPNQDRVLT